MEVTTFNHFKKTKSHSDINPGLESFNDMPSNNKVEINFKHGNLINKILTKWNGDLILESSKLTIFMSATLYI